MDAPDDKADSFFAGFTGVLNTEDARDDDGDVTLDLSAFFCIFSRSLAAIKKKLVGINRITQENQERIVKPKGNERNNVYGFSGTVVPREVAEGVLLGFPSDVPRRALRMTSSGLGPSNAEPTWIV